MHWRAAMDIARPAARRRPPGGHAPHRPRRHPLPGLGSIGGSFVAASLLGISDMAGKYYFPELGAFLIYFVMVALLMWRPVGLFGRR